MSASGKVTVKLLVDKEKNRVIFAESEKDLVDILFSFLTLPLGTIVRLLEKKSGLGCLDNLYQSVETLDPLRHLQTKACSTMLLRPLSSAAVRCMGLSVNIDNTSNPKQIYVCSESKCCSKAICFMSTVQNTQCGYCGESMNVSKYWKDGVVPNEVGGFVKEGLNFMITDDLHVIPASKMHTGALLDKMGIRDWSALEERTLCLGSNEVLNLLKWALLSKMPLTKLCFPHTAATVATEDELDTKDWFGPMREIGPEFRKINLKLLLDKTNKVVQAEAGEELMDLLLSFLAFPLGLVIKLLSKNSTIGCIDNLYGSVEALNNDHMQSDECMNMLLSPKLASFFGSNNQLMKVDEAFPREVMVPGCHSCYWGNKHVPVCFVRNDFSSRQEINSNNYRSCIIEKCVHGLEYSVLRELNPKRSDGSTEVGGGYTKGPRRILVTDDLCIAPFSPISSIQVMKKSNKTFTNLVERETNIGESQVVHLLRAALTSQFALSNVFSNEQEDDGLLRAALTSQFTPSNVSSNEQEDDGLDFRLSWLFSTS